MLILGFDVPAAKAVRVGNFLVERYPFLEAFFICLTLSVQPHVEKDYGMPHHVLIGYLFLAVAVGTGMCFDIQKRMCALIFAAQLFLISLTIQSSPLRSEYHQWTKVRLFARNLGLIGGYVMISGGVNADRRSGEPKTKYLLRYGRIALGVYAISSAWLLMNSEEDRKALIIHMPGGGSIVMVYVVAYVLYGLCIISEFEKIQMYRCLFLQLFFTTLLVDGDVKYWMRSHTKMQRWPQYHMMSRNIFISFQLWILMFTDTQ
ncbi:Transmembrane protein 101 [Trichoplax sp. H2]|uniref:Transmembrane protein 101 n=1 Tax=Trichoplax adhaerens TaxID=10228 RepID=B3RLG7_TRIAD|nr:hypothetical protein TRIADDRAFT_51994 [Trichoplax adhaerens]EDV29535.1 hypothetical protein TRIADDRAFT_51994 [Trichoplax adhaerens]RDD38179.1 Transmembrane protein 101 [Trichoplax sp. H2]|eukprot:XP_002108737.1 hypothetical protein TRIADDRAFT_51994 [Trichoplax adhaerens]